MKPYYDEGGVTIYHGDSAAVLAGMADKSVDLVLTDPPYNVGKEYGQHNDKMAADEYREWCASWFAECRRVAKRVVVFCGHGNTAMWSSIEPPRSMGCWHKPGAPGRASVFQFCEWEPFLVWGGGFALGSNVIRATITKQRDTGDHPCPKPLPLFAQLIKQFRPKSVLDPFMGSGTTLVAAKAAGVTAVGVELEERFCRTAVQRLAQMSLAESAA